MANMNPQVTQAVTLFKAGRKEEAKTILMDIVDKDERNEQAWLWLSAMVDGLEEQQICLDNVLSINPANERARKRLDAVNEMIASQSGGIDFTPPAPPPPAAPSGRSGGMPIGAEFTSFEPPPPDSSFDSWLSRGTDNSAFSSSSSVDWAHPDAPATHGSGKNVELPSSQEFDSWMQSMNIGGGSPSESLPSFESGSVNQFGDTSFMVDSGPFESEIPPARSTPDDSFGSNFYQPSEAMPWGEEIPSDPPASSSSPQPFGRGYSGGIDDLNSLRAEVNQAGFGSPFGSFDNAPNESTEEEMRFDFDDAPNESNGDFASVFDEAPQRASVGKGTDYYQYIPNNIEALSSGGSKRGLVTMGGVIVLGLLNLIAAAFLVIGLVG